MTPIILMSFLGIVFHSIMAGVCTFKLLRAIQTFQDPEDRWLWGEMWGWAVLLNGIMVFFWAALPSISHQ